MKTYKKGISLIVLVITIIILSILATVVITTLSETNIINKANITLFKNDMASYKEKYQFYLTNKLLEDSTFKSDTLNVASSETAKISEILGNDIKDEYKNNFGIIAGRLIYKTAEREKIAVLKELNMAITVIPEELQLGDKVIYTPDANPTTSYTGVTYKFKEDSSAETYAGSSYNKGYYEEKSTTYTPGTHEYVYMGQDENGNALLVSTTVSGFTVTLGGGAGWTNGSQQLDELCNTLYGSKTYGRARNINIQDFNRLVNYTGSGYGYIAPGSAHYVATKTGLTVGEIEEKYNAKFSNRLTPNKDIEFEEYVANLIVYQGDAMESHDWIAVKSQWSNTSLSESWISSPYVLVQVNSGTIRFFLRYYSSSGVSGHDVFLSDGEERAYSFAVRPVIVLNSNIQITKTGDTWTLVEL